MTTNQTIDGVPRGEPVYQVSDGVNGWSDVDLLRYTACCLDPEEYECRVLYAEQPLGVPVARITLQQVLKAYDYANCHPHKYLRGTTNWCAAAAHSLNAEQPAPVAVVLPERPYASEDDQQSMTEYEIGLGHGACEMWDKIKTLNAPRPPHANPPPGTEPSGTHPHNDGLDEWRKPDAGKDRRAELLESLAKQVYDSWDSQPGFVPWVDGGNSLKQDEARQIASRTFELALANQVGD